MTVLDLTAESPGGWAAQITNGPGGYGGVVADEEWAAEVRRLATQRNATLLAHNYQLPAIQDVADHVGDSLALSRIAAEAPEDTIVFCGVHFMAETAKILSPEKTVLIPDQRAGCSLADSITADDLRAWKDEYPGAVVVSYVNTTAAVKALTDVCCTSSNAVEVVASIPEDREVLFCPDQFLGAHVRRVTGRKNLHVWAGECHVHAGINGDELAAQARAHPDAELFVHPECGCATSALYLAGEGAFPDDRVKILSTGGMLDAARDTRARQVLVATEIGMLHQLRRAAPEVDFRAVNDRASCKYMKMITPAALLRCLVEGADEVHVDAETAGLARAQRAAHDRDRAAWRRGMTPLAAAGRRRRHRHRCGRSGGGPGGAPRGRRVVVLSKASERRGRRLLYAQGGIAVVLPETDDSIEAHVADTLAAGGGLCDPEAVTPIVADGYAAVADLVDDGARFDESAPGGWSLTREGGHSRRRIIHAGGDATGAEVQRALDRAAAMLDIRRNHVALQVLQRDGAVTGVLVHNDDGLGMVHAPSVILATGGLGHLYAATTNPEGSTGDGIALALWAGVALGDVEFIQFHPTMLFDGHAGGRRPLITEAIRGEGAVLVDARGNSVTAGVHPLGDLAPRDVVAAAIDARLADTGDQCVYLDARALGDFPRRFPTVTAACLAAGIDPTRQLIPVVPGAHYSCGGVVADVYGRTELSGLFAAGEVARTGMHGANRLASNSLLEGLVVGSRAGAAAARHAVEAGPADGGEPDPFERVALPRNVLQRAMSSHASVVRDADGLRGIADLLAAAPVVGLGSRTALEDAALTATAGAVVTAALERTESRGCHHRSDYPDTDPAMAVSAVARPAAVFG